MDGGLTIWHALLAFFICIAAFVMIQAWFWRRNASIFQSLWLWLKAAPLRRRYRRDPEFKRRVDLFNRYQQTLLFATVAVPNKVKEIGELMGRREDPTGQIAAAYSKLLEVQRKAQASAAEFLSAMSDQDLRTIAEFKRQFVYADLLSVEAIADFMERERELIRGRPNEINGHLVREIQSLGPLFEQAKADLEKADQGK